MQLGLSHTFLQKWLFTMNHQNLRSRTPGTSFKSSATNLCIHSCCYYSVSYFWGNQAFLSIPAVLEAMAKENYVCDKLLLIEEDSFRHQLKHAVSKLKSYIVEFWFNLIKFSNKTLFNHCHLHFNSLFKGFSSTVLTPGEAAAILWKAEHHLSWEITPEEISSG